MIPTPVNICEVLGSASALKGAWQMAHKQRNGILYFFFADALLSVVSINRHTYAILTTQICFTLINLRAFWLWYRKEPND